MMGMKRRGLGRRQVLNLNNDKQDSPRRTWQTKYQQICAEHSSQNGNHSDGITSTSAKSPIKSNPLTGLVGQYHSDSDTEDEGKTDSDQLNNKVSDFLKEIQTISPVEYSVASPSPSPLVPQVAHTVPAVPKEVQEVPQHASVMGVAAWQECYDETSGYVYYWNMETNEVTWEMPPGYQAYVESVAASQEKHWIQEQHMAMMPAQMMAHVQAVPAVVPYMETTLVVPRVEENVVNSSKPSTGKKNKSKNKDIDSDDERIEMITSYGPASDDSDDDEEDDELPPPIKRKKGATEKSRPLSKAAGNPPVSTKRLELPVMGPDMQIGPQPEPVGPMLMEPEVLTDPMTLPGEVEVSNIKDVEEHAEGSDDEESPLLSANVPDLGAPGDEIGMTEQEIGAPGSSISNKGKEPSQDDGIESEIKDGPYPVPDSSEDKSKVDADLTCVKSNSADTVSSAANNSAKWRVNMLKSEEVEQSEELVAGSGTSTPIATTTEGESDVESGETDEGVILSRLRSQARILKELGGEIPDEIQHLIDPTTTLVASPPVAEDVIAQIEKELPPDYQESEDKEKEISSIHRKKNHPSDVSSVENSPRTSSFALIAGYGDDSEPEEEKKVNKLVKSKSTEQVEVESSTLFPIVDQKEMLNTVAGSIGESSPSVSAIETSHNVESDDTTLLDGVASIATAPQPGVVLFPAAINAEILLAAETHEPVTSAFVGGALDSNLPDSTTSSKTFKRKKRLDLDRVIPSVSAKPSVASATSMQPADVKSEKEKPVQPVAVTSAVAASASATYTTWTCYNADPVSGERRGFGFQSNKNEDAGFLVPDILHTEQNKSTSPRRGTALQKKGISFIKAETLNPVPEEEQDVKSSPSEGEHKPDIHAEVKVEAENKEEEEARHQIDEMAQLIAEKLNFLGEGKEPVSPVQVMAIQIETLVSAWQMGALSRSYWSRWLTGTAAELARLEQVAAPDDWACEWDRYDIHFNSTFCLFRASSSCQLAALTSELDKNKHFRTICCSGFTC